MRDDSSVEILRYIRLCFVIANDATIRVFTDFISVRLGFNVAKDSKVRVFDDLFCHGDPFILPAVEWPFRASS